MKIRIIMLVCVLGVGIYLAGCSVGDSRTTDDSSAAQVAENIELTEMNNIHTKIMQTKGLGLKQPVSIRSFLMVLSIKPIRK